MNYINLENPSAPWYQQTSVWKSLSPLSHMIRKFVPHLGQTQQDMLLAKELERLAQLSPHLLADIGMTPAKSEDASGTVNVQHNKETLAGTDSGSCAAHISRISIQDWSRK